MTTVDKRPDTDLPLTDVDKDFGYARNLLGLVRTEPLSAMLKVVRVPPPMFDGQAAKPTQKTEPSQTSGTAHSQKKLAATKMVLDLAQLVIQRENEMDEIDNPDVKQGFEEVYSFLLNSEHLRSMQST